MVYRTAALAALVAAASAAQDSRTFAVLRFYGNGPLVEGRMDPIISPNETSGHVHTIMGGSNFGIGATGESLLASNCSTALIKNDHSAYWYPKLYFQDPKNGSFEPVDLFYMNVYYFFEPTNDETKAFPLGLQMVSGNAMTRVPPGSNGTLILDPSQGTIQPTQWTCPRSSYDPPSYPVGSNGTVAGQVDPNNQGSGTGFPFAECDGYASPLRMDLHFPSCYNPAAELTDYKNNMQFPVGVADGKQDCPKGWTHTPHIFFEVYWNTPLFIDRWTPNDGYQPFVLSEGDVSGYSAHGDFIAAWDEITLQTIIDTCNAGDDGMDKCPDIPGGLADTTTSCNIVSPIDEQIYGVLDKLPGDNPLGGWGVNNNYVPDMGGSSSSTSSSSLPSSVSSSDSSSSGSSGSSSGSSSGRSGSSSVDSSSSSPAASSANTPNPSPTSVDDRIQETGAASSSPSAPAVAPPTPTTMSTQLTAPSPPQNTPAPAGGAGGGHSGDDDDDVVTVVDVVTDIVTVWDVVTVTDDVVAAPTGAAKVRRSGDLHDHVLRHRSRPFGHWRS